ncbi:MAG TPA: hypothetical protein VIF15_22110 [Polyangiaceae bacterium]
MSALFANYTAVSKRLGLAFEDGRIHGMLDGIALQMSFGTYAVHVAALLPRTAPLDLSIATKTLIGKLGDLFGGHSQRIGDPEMDKVFSVKASDVDRVAALLGPEARRALLDLEKEGLHPSVDAHSIHLRRFSASAIDDSQEKIERDFREAARLARVVSDAFGVAGR